MFERRLKIFLVLLCLITLFLVGRAMQIQVFGSGYWKDQAATAMKRHQLVETTRGPILDYKGRSIAIDVACIDAAVDYRAVTHPPDPKWVEAKALDRLHARGFRRPAKSAREAEVQKVLEDVEAMWATLARVSAKPGETFTEAMARIEETRHSIEQRVAMRRRYVWHRNFEKAAARHEEESKGPAPWYRKWLGDRGDEKGADGEEENDGPRLDQFAVEVAEQTEPHVILRAIDTETNNLLGKNIEQFPGLVLRPSTHRYYPYEQAACHLLGRVARVDRDDMNKDPNKYVEERKYFPNDLIGRGGLEGLCEQLLRGTRGRIERELGQQSPLASIAPQPGQPVRSTIDIELQAEIEQFFAHAELPDPVTGVMEKHAMHGGAVVIDVKTGEVRALASYPTFNPNELDDRYAELAKDYLNTPLLNRATQDRLEPGSTVKPLVGISAITAGRATPEEGIECTGYLIIDGKRLMTTGRCWVASMYEKQLKEYGMSVAHHPVPTQGPHHGIYGNKDGFLCFEDAIQRSCNVYFETIADRLGMDGLSLWLGKFGLGQRTGIGIAEAEGELPSGYKGPARNRRAITWFGGIGQQQVMATPIQMANAVATIARDGTWLRPCLVPRDLDLHLPATRPSAAATNPAKAAEGVPDRVDLHLDPAALAAAKRGMIKVINDPAGTGYSAGLARKDVLIAGKTGTAQTGKLTVPKFDPKTGEVVKDEDGRPLRQVLEPITPNNPRPDPYLPWYRGSGGDGTKLDHAWFVGFAPANDPQIAFCVMVEYGGSGGVAAGGIARHVIDACVEHGYLKLDARPARDVAAGDQ